MSRNNEGPHFVGIITRTVFDPDRDSPRIQVHKCSKCKGIGCDICHGTGNVSYMERPRYTSKSKRQRP